MEHQPQNENHQDNDPIRQADTRYNIVKVVYESDDAFPTYSVLKNERDSDGNRTGNVTYQPGWKIIGEGINPDNGDTIYKLSPVGDQVSMAKYLTPDQLRSMQEKAAKLSRIESGIAAAAERFAQRQAELTQAREYEYEDESSQTKSAEEARKLIDEAHRQQAQNPVIPNLEQMMGDDQKQEEIIDKLPWDNK